MSEEPPPSNTINCKKRRIVSQRTRKVQKILPSLSVSQISDQDGKVPKRGNAQENEDEDDAHNLLVENVLSPTNFKRNAKKRMDPEKFRQTCEGLLKTANGMKYSIILADPCWSFGNDDSTLGGLATTHYETMNIHDLMDLPVKEIVAKDSILLLWVCPSLLIEGLALMQAWGFQYVTTYMNWIKTTNGKIRGPRLGYYTRQFVESVLMGKRIGGCSHKLTIPGFSIPNVFLEDSKEHSQKPKHVKETIDTLFEDIPRIELFARESTDLNWDYWGNETNKFGTSSRDVDKIKEIRTEQLKKVEMLGKAKRLRGGGGIDSGNIYGTEKNRQHTITDFFGSKEKTTVEID